MGIVVPIPMGIKDRGIYAALVKIARGLSKAVIMTIISEDTADIADDAAVPNSASFQLQESFEIDTGVPWIDYNNNENLYSFTAGFEDGDVVFDTSEGQVYLDVKVAPVSLADTNANVLILVDLYTKKVTSILNASFRWKVRKLS